MTSTQLYQSLGIFLNRDSLSTRSHLPEVLAPYLSFDDEHGGRQSTKGYCVVLRLLS